MGFADDVGCLPREGQIITVVKDFGAPLNDGLTVQFQARTNEAEFRFCSGPTCVVRMHTMGVGVESRGVGTPLDVDRTALREYFRWPSCTRGKEAPTITAVALEAPRGLVVDVAPHRVAHPVRVRLSKPGLLGAFERLPGGAVGLTRSDGHRPSAVVAMDRAMETMSPDAAVEPSVHDAEAPSSAAPDKPTD